MGVRLSPHFASGDSIIDGLSKILRPLTTGKNDESDFTVEQVAPFGLIIATNEGFRYQVDHTKVSVVFHHRMKAKQVSGGPPVMQLLSSAAPFSELLPRVSQKLVDAIIALPANGERSLLRVGVISTTTVAREDLPPGLKRFIEYVGKPWGRGIDDMLVNIFGNLNDNDQWSDRCGHQMQLFDDEDKLPIVVLDYQRTFKNPSKINEDRLKQLFRQTSDDAVEYFERVAEGSMFDEQLIGSASN